jgi:hypothetical protein
VCAKLAEHYLAERRNLPSHSKPCLPSSVEQIVLVVESKKVAPFLSELGDMGRAALRLQAPTLATCPSGPRPTDEPQCALCHQQPESPMHLLHHCSGLPADIRAERADLMKTRAFEVRYANDWPLKYGLATTMAETWSASFIWEGRSHHTTARLLWLAGRMIDYYSNQATRLRLLIRRPLRAARDALCRPLESGRAAFFPMCAAGGSPKGMLFRVMLDRR